MKFKSSIIILLSVITMSFLSNTDIETKPVSTEHFSADIPSDWIPEKMANGDMLIYPLYGEEKLFGGSINKISEITSEEDDIMEYVFLTKTSLAQFQNATITNEEVKEINSIQARVISYEIKSYGKDELGILYIFRDKAKAYQVSFKGTFAEFKKNEVFAKMVANSFKIKQ